MFNVNSAFLYALAIQSAAMDSGVSLPVEMDSAFARLNHYRALHNATPAACDAIAARHAARAMRAASDWQEARAAMIATLDSRVSALGADIWAHECFDGRMSESQIAYGRALQAKRGGAYAARACLMAGDRAPAMYAAEARAESALAAEAARLPYLSSHYPRVTYA